MQQKRLKFSKDFDKEFYNTLKQRVNEYFDSNNIPRSGNRVMFFKSAFMIALYVIPYIVMISGAVTNPVGFIFLWILMGVGMAGIGLSIMHDANHGAYSRKKLVNKAMGYTMNIVGCNATTWKLQHNVLHHSYTNVHGADEDIDTSGLMRFSPHQKRTKLHRFQHFYAWFLYGFMTLNRITVKDFAQIIRFKKMGLVKNSYTLEILKVLAWKIFYYLYILVLPLALVPVSPWLIVISFIMMHMVNGLILSLVFQSAHVMPSTEFNQPDDHGIIQNNWAVHQMITTANFSPANRSLSWFIGGLNYQIEHHLFSNICHVHYRELSKIVSSTASEFGIPYNSKKSFISAIADHGRMLKMLGKYDAIPSAK
jgi:linoleoyl-CoA desaturase